MKYISKCRVVTHKVRWLCGKPCPGEMLPTGICLTSYPAQYPHKCDTCGRVENADETYPYIEHSER